MKQMRLKMLNKRKSKSIPKPNHGTIPEPKCL